MKRLTTLSFILCASSLTVPFSVNADAFKAPSSGAPSDRVGAGTRHSEGGEDVSTDVTPAPVTRGIFKTPKTGAPTDRVGAGTRHSEDKEDVPETVPETAPITRSIKQGDQSAVDTLEKAQLLVSSHSSLTASATPTLYWYVTNVPAYGAEIVLQSSDKTVLKKTVNVTTAGMQSIRLADLGVQLKAGASYVWSVSLIVDPKQQSKNLSSFANIRYEPSSDSLTDVEDMKQAGYWYDAISRLVESKSPQLSDELSKQGIILLPVSN